MDVQPPIRAGAPPSHYQAYLNSSAWKTTRNRALKRSGYQCAKCPARRDLEVHHLTYERLGLEHDNDVEVLCVLCHRGEHLRNPDQTSLGIYLKIASVALKHDPFASVADLADMVKTACAKLKIPAPEGRINSALALIIGNRLQAPPQEFHPTPKADPMAVSRGDAREILIRLFAKFDAPLVIKQMSASTPRSVIDIYAPVPDQDWGDHDLY